MTLREAIEQYVLWRKAHGAKFTSGANLLRQLLRHADGDAECDAVSTAQVLAFLAGAGPLTRHRENKYLPTAVIIDLCAPNLWQSDGMISLWLIHERPASPASTVTIFEDARANSGAGIARYSRPGTLG